MLDDFLEAKVNFIIGPALIICWVKGIATDATANKVAWVIADVIVPPIGMLRGLFAFFG